MMLADARPLLTGLCDVRTLRLIRVRDGARPPGIKRNNYELTDIRQLWVAAALLDRMRLTDNEAMTIAKPARSGLPFLVAVRRAGRWRSRAARSLESGSLVAAGVTTVVVLPEHLRALSPNDGSGT